MNEIPVTLNHPLNKIAFDADRNGQNIPGVMLPPGAEDHAAGFHLNPAIVSPIFRINQPAQPKPRSIRNAFANLFSRRGNRE